MQRTWTVHVELVRKAPMEEDGRAYVGEGIRKEAEITTDPHLEVQKKLI